jgi:tetratricopeptide (TPR) repeat protein
MGFRFFKRVNIFPGVTLNLSKSGGSVSVGPQGARLTVGPRGSKVTLGVPGSGLFYTTDFSWKKLGQLLGQSSAEKAKDQLSSEVFPHLTMPDDQRALAEGCKELALGNETGALAHLRQAVHLADGAFLAGFLALRLDRLEDAVRYLTAAASHEHELGRSLTTYGIGAAVTLPVTEEVSAHLEPNIRGVLLALAETYQAQERWREAIDCLDRLQQLEPDDVVVRLSLAELLLEQGAGDQDTCQRVIQLSNGIENESAVHSALLLYKAQALRGLGLLEAALEVLTGALARKKNRPDEVLRALRYERALVYEGLGQTKRARTEWQKLYAEAPEYEDVAARLGF